MQYREEIVPYRRTYEKIKKEEKNSGTSLYQIAAVGLTAFLASRALVGGIFMPLGIAYAAACSVMYGPLEAFISAVCAAAGYILAGGVIVSDWRAVPVFAACAASFAISRKSRIRAPFILTVEGIFIIITGSLYSMFIKGNFSTDSLIRIVAEGVVSAAVSFLMISGIKVLRENKEKYKKWNNAVIFMILCAMAAAGLRDTSIISIRPGYIIVLALLPMLGERAGAGLGAAAGISGGILLGMSDCRMPYIAGVLGIIGASSGIFKGWGRFVSAAVFIMTAAILRIVDMAGGNTAISIREGIAAAVIYIAADVIFSRRLGCLDETEAEKRELQKYYADKLKDLFNMRAWKIHDTLVSLADILDESIENEMLRKAEIEVMVEKIADRSCSGCTSKEFCWKREAYYTYNSFVELLRNSERNGSASLKLLSAALKEKCMRPNEIIKQVNISLEVYRQNNKWKRKLLNSRRIVAEQIRGVAGIMDSLTEEMASSAEVNNIMEREIEEAFNKKGLDFEEILAVKNNRGKYEITVYRKPCKSGGACSRDYAQVLTQSIGKKMLKTGGICKRETGSTSCCLRYIEAENYDIVTASSKYSKEKLCGDSSTFGDVGEGRYLIALSDGMGSGAAASAESNTTIALLEKFLEAGFERNTAIKAINSVLVLRACEESYATIDMILIDLYSGIGEFIKVGAAASVIKSGREAELVKTSTLPCGILDEIDAESQFIELKNGDMIVTVSDGIIDSHKDKEQWLRKAVREYESGNPKDMADHILKRAKDNYGDKVCDDMTVLVSKVVKLM